MSDQPTPSEPPPQAPPRQRWRLVVARGPDAPAAAQRDVAESWLAAIEASGLPLAHTEGARARPRIAFGAPLPVGMVADAELIDMVLTERRAAWDVRSALLVNLPDGWRLVDLFDVWLAGPALPGRVAAADYRITLAPGVDSAPVVTAARALLDSRSILRERPKGGGTVRYDLRPLLIDVLVADPGPPPILAVRTRFHPELGAGRPEEVVAALGERLGLVLEVGAIVRERLVLTDDLD